MSHPPMTRLVGSTNGIIYFIGRNTYPDYVSAIFIVEHWVIDPYIVAFCYPFFVFHVMLFLFANKPPKIVEPLLPPKPTMSNPTLPGFFSVRNKKFLESTLAFFVKGS